MKTQAAILVELKKPLVVTEIEIPSLKSGQVLVQIAFSGVCHTQVLECRGFRGEDPYLPHCLGHEGSGTVKEIGPNVKKVKPGDNVILSWMKGSGADISGVLYQWNGRSVNAGGITTFSKHSVISENRLTVIPNKINLDEAALLGCAVPTGIGSVMNTAKPQPKQSIAIFGTGGIGLCALSGAVISGCSPIIAIDLQNEKLELAKQLGATHTINAGQVDPVEEIKRICPQGLDFAIEASGQSKVMIQALHSVRNQGGSVVVIGNARHGERLEIDPKQLNMGKRIFGTWGGDNIPDRDFPRYCDLVTSGKLKLKPFLSKTYRLNEINQAIDDLEAGKVIRPLIEMARN